MKLPPMMTRAQFDNGYWYATELKAFGDRIGIPAAGKLRKDELEKASASTSGGLGRAAVVFPKFLV